MEVIQSLSVLKSYEQDMVTDFIAGCRNGIPHSYDTVKGPMADDHIAHQIPREVFKV